MSEIDSLILFWFKIVGISATVGSLTSVFFILTTKLVSRIFKKRERK